MLLIIKFEGRKFRDLEVNHENNEKWHPMKITCYTVYCNKHYIQIGSLTHKTANQTRWQSCELHIKSLGLQSSSYY